jgi:hypothetical protein
VNHESARGFIEWAQQEKKPEAWQVEQWKAAAKTAQPVEQSPGKEIPPVAVLPEPAGTADSMFGCDPWAQAHDLSIVVWLRERGRKCPNSKAD